jgi:hypothetical protein
MSREIFGVKSYGMRYSFLYNLFVCYTQYNDQFKRTLFKTINCSNLQTMKITISTKKSVHESISEYFDKAKKAKAKIPAIEKILSATRKKELDEQKEELAKIDRQNEVKFKETALSEQRKERKEQWFMKFRWFYTSSHHLVIGGRDADSNELIIKKHVEPGDIIFHTELAGSPFFVLKLSEDKTNSNVTSIDPQCLEEVAQMTAVYSKAWKAEYASATTFWVYPNQVSKHANSGEFMGKGSFMIRGEKNFLQPKVEVYVGQSQDEKTYGFPIVGTLRCMKVNAIPNTYLKLVQGREKPSAIAKEIKKKFKDDVHVDEIIKVLPGGGCRVSK